MAIIGGQVEAELHFLQRLPVYEREQPYESTVPFPAGAHGHRANNLAFETRKVSISDIREAEIPFTLDEHGFQVVYSPTQLSPTALQDPAMVQSQYYSELEALLRSIDGSIGRVFFFDWRLRSADASESVPWMRREGRGSWLQPSGRVHVDNSPQGVMHRLQQHLNMDAGMLSRCRVRIINAWRPLDHEVQDYPLAVCDGQTAMSNDYIPVDRVRGDPKGQRMYVHFSEGQKWYYISRQRREEVTLMKMYDSASDIATRCCPHTSFLDPNRGANPLPRKSIEVRIAVFDPAPGFGMQHFAIRPNQFRRWQGQTFGR